MTARDEIETGADEPDSVALRIAEDERRRSGAFLRDYLARHRIGTVPAEERTPEDDEERRVFRAVSARSTVDLSFTIPPV